LAQIPARGVAQMGKQRAHALQRYFGLTGVQFVFGGAVL